ncbi:MAG: hypothetical protein LBN11_01255, partial [Tannerella sp.]|nr:hypothetical protein [Tannerella sp.]
DHRIETFTYGGSNAIPDGEKRTTGGCKFVPILKRYQSLANDAQFLATLLDRGEIEKIYYYPGTMGLDAILQPYVATGQVEFVPCPDDCLFPNEFNVSVHVQEPRNGYCDTKITYPATDAPAGVGLENIYKVHLIGPRPTLLFAFPSQYEINLQEYKYLKFKVYPPAKSKLAPFGSKYQRVWPRFLNAIWGNDYSPAGGGGSGYWTYTKMFDDNELQTWVDVTVNLAEANAFHNRAFWIGFNLEENSDNSNQTAAIEAADINYYVSNFRLAK